jgi:hypothetical protein|tara:strand:- start:7185 stop:7652 length:468 start_codon:yes stop_codon:yes gene_type:complete
VLNLFFNHKNNKMSELEILNYHQLAFVANAIYLLSFTVLVFITFRLVRFQKEANSNIFGKVLVSLFGLCTAFYGYTIFSFTYNLQLGQAYRLSEIKANGAELSTVTDSFIEFIGYSTSDGWPPSFSPEPAALIFIVTFCVMIIAGTWMNLSNNKS